MRKEDFVFLKVEKGVFDSEPYKDIYFIPSDKTSKELEDMYMEQSMQYIKYVIYPTMEDKLYITKQFMFNETTECIDNPELKKILGELVKDMNV